MKYLHVRLSEDATGQHGYIEELDYFLSAHTRSALEYETFRVIEQIEGLHSFSIIWKD